MTRCLFSLLFTALLGAAAPAQEYWPQWRGPDQRNIAASENLPVTWGESENIVWKAPMPSWSGSSPIIWGDRIFVSTPSAPDPASREQREAGGPDILLLCLSKADGSELWRSEVCKGNPFAMKHNGSSPTPVTDGAHVWTLTGTGVLAAYDMDGNPLWKRDLQAEHSPFGLLFGYASSPVLHNGKIIVQVLHGYKTEAPSYLAAYDALTGAPVWHLERRMDVLSETHDAYTTPFLLAEGDKTIMIITGGGHVTGHDPGTGRELWRASGLDPQRSKNYRVITSATAGDGMVFAPSRQRPVLGIRTGGEGDVTATHTAWTWTKPGGPDVPTPVYRGGCLYMVDDSGNVRCLDAKTGDLFWGPERTVKGIVSASPLLAGNRLYITNEEGVTSVLQLSPDPKLLASNTLPVPEGRVLSSLAVSGDRLYLRTPTHLYCIGAE